MAATNLTSCYKCTKEGQETLYKIAQMRQSRKEWYGINDTNKCPGKCCADGDLDCRITLDATGFPTTVDDEFLLIFGGMSYRKKSYFDTLLQKNQSIFDFCEDYFAQASLEGVDPDDVLKNCGEEIMNDLWRYSLTKNTWYPIKLDYNHYR